MSDRSSIEWHRRDVEPGPGMYQDQSRRLPAATPRRSRSGGRGVKGHPYEMGFDPRLASEQLDLPLRWRCVRAWFLPTR